MQQLEGCATHLRETARLAVSVVMRLVPSRGTAGRPSALAAASREHSERAPPDRADVSEPPELCTDLPLMGCPLSPAGPAPCAAAESAQAVSAECPRLVLVLQ